MKEAFDGLSKALAEGVSRREAIRRFGIATAAAAAAVVLPGRARAASGDPFHCKQFCNWLYGQGSANAKHCISQAGHHQGACYDFGPAGGACKQIACPPHTFCVSAGINQTARSTEPFCVPF